MLPLLVGLRWRGSRRGESNSSDWPYESRPAPSDAAVSLLRLERSQCPSEGHAMIRMDRERNFASPLGVEPSHRRSKRRARFRRDGDVRRGLSAQSRTETTGFVDPCVESATTERWNEAGTGTVTSGPWFRRALGESPRRPAYQGRCGPYARRGRSCFVLPVRFERDVVRFRRPPPDPSGRERRARRGLHPRGGFCRPAADLSNGLVWSKVILHENSIPHFVVRYSEQVMGIAPN